MLNKINPGDTLTGFPAGTWNSLIDAVQLLQRGRRRFSADSSAQEDGPAFQWKNVSGSNAPAGAIIKPTGFQAVDNAAVFTGDKPDSGVDLFNLISIGPCADGDCADCTIFDPVRANYSTGSGSPSFGQIWGKTPSQWYLSKDLPGFYIGGYSFNDGTGARVWAIQYPLDQLIGKTTGTVNTASSGTINIWVGSGGSEVVTAGPMTVTAWNNTTVVITSGKWVKLSRINGVWYMEPWQC